MYRIYLSVPVGHFSKHNILDYSKIYSECDSFIYLIGFFLRKRKIDVEHRIFEYVITAALISIHEKDCLAYAKSFICGCIVVVAVVVVYYFFKAASIVIVFLFWNGIDYIHQMIVKSFGIVLKHQKNFLYKDIFFTFIIYEVYCVLEFYNKSCGIFLSFVLSKNFIFEIRFYRLSQIV